MEPPISQISLPPLFWLGSVQIPPPVRDQWRWPHLAKGPIVAPEPIWLEGKASPKNPGSGIIPCYLCCQMGHLCHKCPLMERDIGWDVYPTGCARAGWNPPLTVPIHIGQRLVMALLNTGSSISMIRALLVPQDRLVLQYSTVAGIHQQVRRWPMVHMRLGYNDHTQGLVILKVDDLPFPVLLQRDAPAFSSLSGLLY